MAPRISLLAACIFLTGVIPSAWAGGAPRPQVVDLETTATLPYRLSGRLLVTQKGKRYQGTATMIRRYTAATAGHMLYAGNSGFSTNVAFQQALNILAAENLPDRRVMASAVVAGYQSAANRDENSTDSFALDLGMLLFAVPAPGNEWAAWTADPDAVGADPAVRLALGYAAESFEGDQPAVVSPPGPFKARRPRYFTSSAYYTEGGMSGGPLYLGVDQDPTNAGRGPLRAVVISGTSYPDPAISGVRALGPEDRAMFIEAEYVNGLVSGGKLNGPAEVSAGGTYLYKVGVIYGDGTIEKKRYDELTLTATDPTKAAVVKTGNDRFQVSFPVGLGSGDSVTLLLGRATASDAAPLRLLTVKVQ